MNKKNPVIGGILGLFIFGLFYATGLTKKGLIAVVVLLIVQSALTMVDPSLATIISVTGAYLGYRWSADHNAQLDGGKDQEW